ncbi:MAG TPA: aminotransferase class V-fold PLP-dependent enzyme [Clostridiales bacterium]|nr:aminotransferase class V-fold PLP-dependent enzyme [Clostridiales bacterium]HPV02143.1 aminotransferase class V-fold PLP-dependent enzyme [Clostridiales bacterium]
MIYLDNAATSFPKPSCVCREMDRCMREYCANPGRGGHALSLRAGMAVNRARDTVCRLFNIRDPMRLAFTKNATEALNIAIKGLVYPGCHVITTPMEHNAVMRPLRTLERDMGIEISVVKGNDFGEIDPFDIRREIKKNTVLIVSTLSSNVNGIIMPVAEIGRTAREYGIPFLVDASQGAGSLPVDVEAWRIDMLAFPGHKGLMGPQGTGGLFVREGIRLRTLMEGGTGSNSEYVYQPEIMPDMLESGTLNTPGIVGLGAGADYVLKIGTGTIHEYKSRLTRLLADGLAQIPGVRLYSFADGDRNSGIVAMNLADMDPAKLSFILDKDFGICTRAGLHCSPAAHVMLGTSGRGSVRFSVGCFNTENDVIYAVEAVERIAFNAAL